MNVPGFTAEASLYHTSRPYQVAGMPEQVTTSVQPTYFLGAYLGVVSCFGRCLGTCPRNPSGQVDRYCRYICAEQCGGAPYIPSVHALNF